MSVEPFEVRVYTPEFYRPDEDIRIEIGLRLKIDRSVRLVSITGFYNLDLRRSNVGNIWEGAILLNEVLTPENPFLDIRIAAIPVIPLSEIEISLVLNYHLDGKVEHISLGEYKIYREDVYSHRVIEKREEDKERAVEGILKRNDKLIYPSIKALLQYFVGRVELLDIIKNKIKRGVILFEGDTGVGKSAFAMKIASDLKVPCILIGKRFSKRVAYRPSVSDVLNEIVEQLKHYYGVYVPPEPDKIKEALYKIYEELGEIPFLILDGVDEAKSPEEIIKLLPMIATENSKILVLYKTGTISKEVINSVKAMLLKEPRIDVIDDITIRAMDPNNLEDIREYIELRVSKLIERGIIRRSFLISDIKDKIYKIINGRFIVAETLFGLIEKNPRLIDKLKETEIPTEVMKSLSWYYFYILNLVVGDNEQLLLILTMISIAKEPLDKNILAAYFHINYMPNARFLDAYNMTEKLIDCIEPFLDGPLYRIYGKLMPFHDSFRMYIIEEKIKKEKIRLIHQEMAKFLESDFSSLYGDDEKLMAILLEYKCNNLIYHLFNAEQYKATLEKVKEEYIIKREMKSVDIMLDELAYAIKSARKVENVPDFLIDVITFAKMRALITNVNVPVDIIETMTEIGLVKEALDIYRSVRSLNKKAKILLAIINSAEPNDILGFNILDEIHSTAFPTYDKIRMLITITRKLKDHKLLVGNSLKVVSTMLESLTNDQKIELIRLLIKEIKENRTLKEQLMNLIRSTINTISDDYYKAKVVSILIDEYSLPSEKIKEETIKLAVSVIKTIHNDHYKIETIQIVAKKINSISSKTEKHKIINDLLSISKFIINDFYRVWAIKEILKAYIAFDLNNAVGTLKEILTEVRLKDDDRYKEFAVKCILEVLKDMNVIEIDIDVDEKKEDFEITLDVSKDIKDLLEAILLVVESITDVNYRNSAFRNIKRALSHKVPFPLKPLDILTEKESRRTFDYFFDESITILDDEDTLESIVESICLKSKPRARSVAIFWKEIDEIYDIRQMLEDIKIKNVDKKLNVVLSRAMSIKNNAIKAQALIEIVKACIPLVPIRAKEILKIAESVVESIADIEDRIRLELELAKLYATFNINKARRIINSTITIARLSINDKYKTELIRTLIDIINSFDLNDEMTIEILDRIVEVIATISDAYYVDESLNNVIPVISRITSPHVKEVFLNKLLNIAEFIDDYHSKCLILLKIAKEFRSFLKSDEMKEVISKVFSTAKLIRYEDEKIEIFEKMTTMISSLDLSKIKDILDIVLSEIKLVSDDKYKAELTRGIINVLAQIDLKSMKKTLDGILSLAMTIKDDLKRYIVFDSIINNTTIMSILPLERIENILNKVLSMNISTTRKISFIENILVHFINEDDSEGIKKILNIVFSDISSSKRDDDYKVNMLKKLIQVFEKLKLLEAENLLDRALALTETVVGEKERVLLLVKLCKAYSSVNVNKAVKIIDTILSKIGKAVEINEENLSLLKSIIETCIDVDPRKAEKLLKDILSELANDYLKMKLIKKLIMKLDVKRAKVFLEGILITTEFLNKIDYKIWIAVKSAELYSYFDSDKALKILSEKVSHIKSINAEFKAVTMLKILDILGNISKNEIKPVVDNILLLSDSVEDIAARALLLKKIAEIYLLFDQKKSLELLSESLSLMQSVTEENDKITLLTKALPILIYSINVSFNGVKNILSDFNSLFLSIVYEEKKTEIIENALRIIDVYRDILHRRSKEEIEREIMFSYYSIFKECILIKYLLNGMLSINQNGLTRALGFIKNMTMLIPSTYYKANTLVEVAKYYLSFDSKEAAKILREAITIGMQIIDIEYKTKVIKSIIDVLYNLNMNNAWSVLTDILDNINLIEGDSYKLNVITNLSKLIKKAKSDSLIEFLIKILSAVRLIASDSYKAEALEVLMSVLRDIKFHDKQIINEFAKITNEITDPSYRFKVLRRVHGFNVIWLSKDWLFTEDEKVIEIFHEDKVLDEKWLDGLTYVVSEKVLSLDSVCLLTAYIFDRFLIRYPEIIKIADILFKIESHSSFS